MSEVSSNDDEVKNLQLNRSQVERTGSTGSAELTAVDGDETSKAAVQQMTGKFRVDMETIDGASAEEKAKKVKDIHQAHNQDTSDSGEMVGAYNATGEEKKALESLERDHQEVTVSLKDDSARDLDDSRALETAV